MPEHDDTLMDAILAVLVAQRLEGKTPDVDGILEAYPERADEIRRRLADLDHLGQLWRSGPTATQGEAGQGRVAAAALQPGTVLGEFEIVRELGRGGMGVVYLARQVGLEREVALKIIPPAALSETTRQRFLREAKALAALSHPNIVPVYTAGESGGSLFIAMEYVQGASLSEILRAVKARRQESAGAVWQSVLDTGSVSDKAAGDAETPADTHVDKPYVRVCLRVILDVARALASAHGQGIVHRDVKPANILIESGGRAQLLDFGLAAIHTEPHVTISGEFFGTPHYVSPEQAQGRQAMIGPATDVYSLGATLYECLTLRPPFDGYSATDVLMQVVHSNPPAASRINRSLAKDLETIVMKCLAKSPAERYASMDDLADDLERYLAGEPIRARPIAALTRAVKWAKRKPAIAALIALVVVVTVIGGAGMYRQWQKAQASRRESQRRALAAKRAKEQADRRARAEGLATELARKAERARVAADLAAQRSQYFQRIALADREWRAARIGEADRLLEMCPQDMRQWEWRFLKWRCHSELRTLTQPGGTVLSLAFSPDGKYLAGGDNALRIWLWDAKTGRLIRSIFRHREPVNGVAFSPNSKYLATGSWDRTVRVWSVPDGRELRVLRIEGDGVRAVAFSPTGDRLAGAGGNLNETGTVKIWRTSDWRELHTIQGHKSRIYSLAFSPDGKHLATGGDDKEVRIWAAETGQQIRVLRGHASTVMAIAYDPSGRYLACVDGKGVRIWDAGSGRMVHSLGGHTTWVWDLAFTPDGRRLVTSGKDSTLRIWDYVAGREITAIRAHVSWSMGVAVSPDGTRLASGSDGEVKIWDASTDQKGLVLPAVGGRFVFAGDWRELAVAKGMDVEIWDVKTRRKLRTLGGHRGGANDMAWSPKGPPRIVTVGGDAAARVWDADAGRVLHTFRGHGGTPLGRVAFSPDGERVASATTYSGPAAKDRRLGEVKVWNSKTGRELHKFSAENVVDVVALAFSPDGRQLAAAWDRRQTGERQLSGVIKVWAAHDGKELLTLSGHKRAITTVAYSPDSRLLASAGNDRTIRIWDAATGDEVLALLGHSGRVYGLAFSPCGRRLASAGETVKLWDTQTGQEAFSIPPIHSPGGFVAVAFSPDGRTLAGGGDGGVRFWTAPVPKPATQPATQPK